MHAVYGNPDLSTEIRRQEVKGNLVRARSRYVRERWGEPAVTALAGSVDAETRQYLLDPPLASDWVAAWPMYELDRAIIEGPMKNDVSQMQSFGKDIASYDLPRVYRSMIQMLTTPAFFMRRTGLIFNMYFRYGVMSGPAEPGRADVELRDVVLPFYMCNYGVSGWFEASIAIYGAKNCRVSHSSCRHHGQSACSWQVTWDK